MTEDQNEFVNVVLVAWGAKGGWADVRLALTESFRHFFPEPVDKKDNDLYDPFERLTEEVLPPQSESKVFYSTRDLSSVESSVRNAVEEQGARQIIVAPLVFALEDQLVHPSGTDIAQRLRDIEKEHPDVEIFFLGPPFHPQNRLENLLESIREHKPDAVELLEEFVARAFDGDWSRFGRFMEILQSSLPAETHVAIRGSAVTGYNYSTGRPFDGLGKGSSDLDIVLLGEEAIGYWKEDGFYVRSLLTMPLGDESPDLAPELEPVRKKLQEVVGRPVHFQAMPLWFLELRRAILKTPYLLLDK